MSDYSVSTDFSVKDGLTTGDPEKIILGADFDVEFEAISTAVATKYDSDDLASLAEAQAETSNVVLMTPGRTANWADANAGIVGDIQAMTDPGADRIIFWDDSDSAAEFLTVGTGLAISTNTLALSHLGIQSLTDPGADRILFWDDGAGSTAWLSVSTGLTLSGTTLTTNDSAIVHDSLSGFVANEHIDHSAVTLTAGEGLSGGGTIAANRSFAVDVSDFSTAMTGAADLDVDLIIIDDAGTDKKATASVLVTPEIGTTVTGTSDTLAETDFGKLVNYSSTSTVTITLPNGLKTGFWAILRKTGASGTVNLSAEGTLQVPNSADSIVTQYASVTVLHLGSNVWTAWGQMV